MKDRIRRRRLLALAMIAPLTVAGISASNAQDKVAYPHDVVTLITHSSPGGGGDVFLREMVKYLVDVMGADFVVENVTGGSSANAIARLAQSPADGTILYTTTPTFIFTSFLSDLEFDYEDVDGLTNFFFDPSVAFARADSPFNSLQEAVEYSKTNRSTWGASNPGSMERMVLEQLKVQTGVEDAAIVTTDGGGETMINVLNGTFDFAVGDLLELGAQLEAGELKLLGVFTEARVETVPDLPTVREQGIDIIVRKFRGLASPKGLPPDIIAAWEEATQRVLEHPGYKEAYAQANLIPGYMGQQEYHAFLQDFAAQTGSFLTAAGVIQSP